MALLRLDKYLTELNIGTRSEVKDYIKKGKVLVNGHVSKKPEVKINTDSDVVIYGNKELNFVEFEYYMLNKPKDVVSATEDKLHTTVLDLIKDKSRKDLFPVGRLDIDTEGLLLITNDGALAHKLLSPKKHVDKKYFAHIQGRVNESDIEVFRSGIDIGEDKLTLPAELKIIKAEDISHVEITIHEGKFHQIKRMFEAVQKEVIYLKRLSMGSLILDDSLGLGEYRRLTDNEISDLKEK